MEYLATIGVLIAIYVILSSSYDLVIGYGGLSTVAHPIFFAIGAYTAGSAGDPFRHCPRRSTSCSAALAAMVASVLLAASALRVSGDYLLIASLGFQLGLLQLIKNLDFTGGPGGLTAIPGTVTGAARTPFFLLVAGLLAVATVLGIRAIVNGPYGRAITAMRDEELAFTALGRDATSMKIVIFAIGCGIAGIAGGVYAYYFQYISPDQFEVLQSAAILTMVVLGGMGTTFGPVVGAVLLLAIPQAITFLNLPPSIMAPTQGIIFTVLVLLFLFLRPAGHRRHRRGKHCDRGAANRESVQAIRRNRRVRLGEPDDRPGRNPRPDRPERRGKDIAVQFDLRRAAARFRVDLSERRGDRRRRAVPARPPGHRPHLAEHVAVPHHDGAGESADRASVVSRRVDFARGLRARRGAGGRTPRAGPGDDDSGAHGAGTDRQ